MVSKLYKTYKFFKFIVNNEHKNIYRDFNFRIKYWKKELFNFGKTRYIGLSFLSDFKKNIYLISWSLKAWVNIVTFDMFVRF